MLRSKTLNLVFSLLLMGFVVVTACKDEDDEMMGPVIEDTFTQVDRVGIPGINTVFNHPPAFSKTDFNTSGPAADVATYAGQFVTVLTAVANPDPNGIAAALLPDELPVSMGAASTNFAMLNGRALADDAVDVALTLLVGVAGLQSDNVNANDVAFLNSFPYLAPPN